ncbi:MAG TPA: DNA polymerase III subunit chi [Psychromonas sp.]
MSQVVFYVFCAEEKSGSLALSAHFAHACGIAAFFYSQNKKVFIYTDTQQDAFSVDEYLWQFDGDSFVPHNLLGEGPKFGTPVEISWQAPLHPRPILINLSQKTPDFAINFQQIIDFVPFSEPEKIAARIRYSAYKKMGLTLSTQTVEDNSTVESTNKTED